MSDATTSVSIVANLVIAVSSSILLVCFVHLSGNGRGIGWNDNISPHEVHAQSNEHMHNINSCLCDCYVVLIENVGCSSVVSLWHFSSIFSSRCTVYDVGHVRNNREREHKFVIVESDVTTMPVSATASLFLSQIRREANVHHQSTTNRNPTSASPNHNMPAKATRAFCSLPSAIYVRKDVCFQFSHVLDICDPCRTTQGLFTDLLWRWLVAHHEKWLLVDIWTTTSCGSFRCSLAPRERCRFGLFAKGDRFFSHRHHWVFAVSKFRRVGIVSRKRCRFVRFVVHLQRFLPLPNSDAPESFRTSHDVAVSIKTFRRNDCIFPGGSAALVGTSGSSALGVLWRYMIEDFSGVVYTKQSYSEYPSSVSWPNEWRTTKYE